MNDIRALLFDLGGVIIDIDWDRAFSHWAAHADADAKALRSRFALDAHYERHERGEIGAAEYYESLRSSLGIDVPHEVFDAGWKSIFPGAVVPTVALLRELRGRIPLYLFSNTNLAHQEAWSHQFADALAPFDRLFTSCGIGARKPERAAFEHVAREIGLPLEAILFFDDIEENVRGARAAGMQAVLVRGPDDVRRAVQPWLPAPARPGGAV
ncbi:MAG TPA: HAD family phosphatase [Usitatibacter sp.]|jgi:putative hydrolase of the HAD superfamily|nr:HAD family phosphatase [Usitatibacter sp.]